MSVNCDRHSESSGKHPSPQQLSTFSGGGGTQAFRAAIAKHVTTCDKCRHLVQVKSLKASEALANGSIKPIVGTDRNSQFDVQSAEVPSPLRAHPQYQFVRELGRGAMGTVYLVEHRLTGRQEALKVLNPQWVERPDVRARFLREIQFAAKLDHPNICRTLNAFEEEKVLGLVMEYLPGTDLGKIVAAHGPLSANKACDFALEVCAGLQYAHQAGLVHRDIKPSNLQVTDNAGIGSLKILDFGLSKGTSEITDESNLTQDGRVLGTPEYMAPEQATSPSTADIRADLYSLGCTLYFLLAGRPPFVGETLYSVIHSHLIDSATPLPELNPKGGTGT